LLGESRDPGGLGVMRKFPLYLSFNLFNCTDAMLSACSNPIDEFLMSELALSPDALRALPQKLHEGFSYWQGLRRGRLMPARRDIDPLDIGALLPNVVLLDVIHQPATERVQGVSAGLDFRFRLVGTEVAARSTRDYTGRRLADIPHMAPGTPFWQRREEVVRCRRPLYSAPCYVGPAKQIRSCHNLLLPLSEDDELVNMIFCLVTFEQTNAGFSDRTTGPEPFHVR